jgi:hypothetical protein
LSYVFLEISFFFPSHPWKDLLKMLKLFDQWKGINRKQSTRWQHLSQLKARVFLSLQFFLVVMKHCNFYLGLVMPSGGWRSLIKIGMLHPVNRLVVTRNQRLILWSKICLFYDIQVRQKKIKILWFLNVCPCPNNFGIFH